MRIFITGIAGMIGYHLAKKLLEQGHEVLGVDSFDNTVYECGIKYKRAKLLNRLYNKNDNEYREYHFVEDEIFSNINTNYINFEYNLKVDVVIHLAALTNPRQSVRRADAYIDTNIAGTNKFIERNQNNDIPHVIYASTSCVMHGNELPWNESMPIHWQNNPYGYTKWVNECQFRNSNFKKTTGLRFFTSYGQFGRPDMAVWKFTEATLLGKEIELYVDDFIDITRDASSITSSWVSRDFTHVSDIVQGIICIINTAGLTIGHDVYNVARGEPIDTGDLLTIIQSAVGKKANIKLKPRPAADTPNTYADISKISKLGYEPKVNIEDGVRDFVDWFKHYHDL